MQQSFARLFSAALVMIVVFVMSATIFVGCDTNNDLSTGSAGNQNPVVLSKSDPAVRAVMSVQDRHTAELMADKNVVAVATGLNEAGRPAILVYLENAPGRSTLPVSIEGVPVVVEVTGKIRAMARGGGVSHTAKQTPPIQLGTSGGWRYDLANGYCCGGTLGSLVKIGSTQYVLSNYHVFRSDIVPGGNNRVATNGDPIIQPGLIDVGCNATNAQNVASLAGSASLPGSNVDCAIASVISGMVRTDGSILEIGTLSASTVGASIGQGVKKSGRTTGLSRSSINGLNASVSVTYDNECAGGTAFTKSYTNQILVKNNGSKFLNSGDSGSLMVEDVTTNPRAVGLLFAGSSTIAVANPIGEVLGFLGASMVGN